MENKDVFIEKLNSIFIDFFRKMKIEVDINMNWLMASDNNKIIEHVKARYTISCVEYSYYSADSVSLRIALHNDENINVIFQFSTEQFRDIEFNFEEKISISNYNQFYTEITLIKFSQFIDSHFEVAKNYLKKREENFLNSWEPYNCEYPLNEDLIDCLINYNRKLLDKFTKLIENKYYGVIDFVNNYPFSTEVQYSIYKNYIIAKFIIKIPLILNFATSIMVEREITENNEDIIFCSIDGDRGFFQRYDFILPTDKDIKNEIMQIIEGFKYEDYFDEFIR